MSASTIRKLEGVQLDEQPQHRPARVATARPPSEGRSSRRRRRGSGAESPPSRGRAGIGSADIGTGAGRNTITSSGAAQTGATIRQPQTSW
jgi:hypothetical protein